MYYLQRMSYFCIFNSTTLSSIHCSKTSKNVLYQHLDIIELPLPYEDATFDYIFIRSMINTLPDALWDDVLKELIRIMKKGAYIECVEAYDNLFDAGPSMNKLNECKSSLSLSLGIMIFSLFTFCYSDTIKSTASSIRKLQQRYHLPTRYSLHHTSILFIVY